MTDYSITLTPANKVNKPILRKPLDSKSTSYDVGLVLSAFDTDGNKGIYSADEVLNAFNYFVGKEKTIGDKKGDRVLNTNDLEQIIKTDSKLSALRKKYGNDKKAADALSFVILSLSSAVDTEKYKGLEIVKMKMGGAKLRDANMDYYELNNKMYTKSEEKIVNGKKVKICKTGKGETYVTTMYGNKYTNPDYVAKCLEYESESTWLGLGAKKYYKKTAETHYTPVGSGGHYVSDRYKQYKVWDSEKYVFVNGEYKRTGERVAHLSSK